MRLLKKVSLLILVVGYAFAGINHFLNPESYIHIIPHYIPFPVLMNIIAGIADIIRAPADMAQSKALGGIWYYTDAGRVFTGSYPNAY